MSVVIPAFGHSAAILQAPAPPSGGPVTLVPVSTQSNSGWTANGAATVHEALKAATGAYVRALNVSTMTIRLGSP